jgi:hypothetical protein
MIKGFGIYGLEEALGVGWSEEKKTFNFGGFDERSGGVFKSQKLRRTCMEKAQACQALWGIG